MDVKTYSILHSEVGDLVSWSPAINRENCMLCRAAHHRVLVLELLVEAGYNLEKPSNWKIQDWENPDKLKYP